MSDLQRLKDVFDFLKQNKYFRNQQDFVERICSDKATVSQILNGKKEYNKQFVCKVVVAFPIISEKWLEFGEGDMLKSEIKYSVEGASTNNTIEEQKAEYRIRKKSENTGVPYFDVDFIGGYDMVENDQSVTPTYYIDFPQYNNADHWINVTGHSMEPRISHGDKIAIKHLNDWETYILYGEIYAIVTDEYRTIKRVRRSKISDDYIRLIPLNAEFDEQDIPKSIVRNVFQVLGAAKKLF